MANTLKLYRGVTYPSSYQHKDANGANLPLTGCTVYVTIKKGKFDEDTTDTANVIFKATITDHTDAPNGFTRWDTVIPATGVAPSKYAFDIVVKNADGSVLPPMVIGECQVLTKPTNRSSS